MAGLLIACTFVPSVSFATLQPCQSNCVEVDGVGPAQPVQRGDAFDVSINFQPGASDGLPGGLDDITALTFTLSTPGLQLISCSNPTTDGLTPSISISPSIASQFRVIIENTSCDSNPARPCLCPGVGQMRADYVNIAIFGLKPASGSLPSLPSGQLLTINMRAGAMASANVVLHVFNGADNSSVTTKPPYGAQASIGDTTGVDLSADRVAGVSRIHTVDGAVSVLPSPTAAPTTVATQIVTLTPTVQAMATNTPLPTATSPAPTVTGTQAPATPSTTAPPSVTMTAAPTHTNTGAPTVTNTVVPTATNTGALTVTNTAVPTNTNPATPIPPTNTVAAPTATNTTASPLPSGTATEAPATATPTAAVTGTQAIVCVGDCEQSGHVSTADLVLGVRIDLGAVSVAQCMEFDVNRDNAVTVDELVAAVKESLGICKP